MSFRRNRQRALKWSKWVEEHRPSLVSCGVPPFLVEDEFRWQRFVEHGYDHETGWSPELLSADHQANLQSFLRKEADE